MTLPRQGTGQGATRSHPLNVVVTGGGTFAPIDDVRRITNVSTGNFSAQISEACLQRGAHVWHVHASSAVLPFRRNASLDLDAPDVGEEFQRLSHVRDSYQFARDRLHLCPIGDGSVRSYARTLREVFEKVSVDIAFLAMAVSDYEPDIVAGKLDSSRETLDLSLHATPKVIRSVRDWAPSAFLVGFKLLSDVTRESLIASAISALETNRVDLTVANDLQTVQRGQHVIHLVRKCGRVYSVGPNGPVAEELVGRVFGWYAERNHGME